MQQPDFVPLWVCSNPEAPLQPADVLVQMNSAFNRAPFPGDLESSEIWAQWNRRQGRLKEGAVLFNGTKFRLGSVASRNGSVVFELGITDYRSLCGTNFVDSHDGQAESALRPHMANALGVEAVVVTSDDFVVLFRRSQFVAENPGWYCCPGGHPEPSTALKRRTSNHEQAFLQLAAKFPASAQSTFARFCDEDSSLANPAQSAEALYAELCDTCLSSELVVAELFQSPLDEVVEELGVDPGLLSNDGLCGVVIATNNHGKPDAIFRVRVNLTASELQAIHARGEAKESYESDGPLLFISVADVKQGSVPHDGIITPPSLACLRHCL